MREESPSPPYLLWPLYLFSATAVASIALQNFIWVAVALFFHLKGGQKINWPKGVFSLATLLFLVSFFTAALWGVDPANSFLNARVHRYLTILLVFFVAAMPLTFRDLVRLLRLYVYGAAFCALFGIGKHFILNQDRIDSFSGDKMVFGGMLMVSLLFLLFFLKESPKNPWLWGSTAVVAVALVLTQTRGAWLGFLVGFVILMWRLSRKGLLVGLFLITASYFFLPSSLQERVKSTTDLHLSYYGNGEIMNSSQTRVLIWISGWKLIKAHPLGVGQGNVEKVFPQYRIHTLDHVEDTVPHLHDNFLQILAQNGWIGLAAYLFWIFAYFRTALGFKSKKTESEGLNWIFLCVFSAVLVWGLTEYTFSHQFMNIQFFLLGLQLNFWRGAASFPEPLKV